MSYIGNKRSIALYDTYTKRQANSLLSRGSALYDPLATYITGDIVLGENGIRYEFYDRDLVGSITGINPNDVTNRPHIWIKHSGLPSGITIEWRSPNLPEWAVENDGAELNRLNYRRIFDALGETYGAGDGTTTFLIPDDRGEFKRGWDNGRGVDAGRTFGSSQSDDYSSHNHGSVDSSKNDIAVRNYRDAGDYGSNSSSSLDYTYIYDAVTTLSGGSETRPRNLATIFITII
jgi:microcystin-dependent protein